MDIQNSMERLKAGTAQIVPEHELVKKLEEGRPLRIKFGMDPTSPDLHLGHAVVLSKLRQFQDLGHEIIVLIGDYTARIGDPTGRSKTRPMLTDQEIKHNTQTYFDQVSKILDPEKTTVRYNAEWLDALTSKEIVQLCAQITLARITQRDDFAQRIKQQQSIGMHELLYPLFQAYDSVELHADVELGGTDQTFNLLLARDLQEQIGQKPQVVLTTPILEGLDGVQKMSKSLGNAIGLTEPADQAYGKLMSLSDGMMWRYYSLLLQVTDAQIGQMQHDVENGAQHPMGLKKKMAHGVIARFWSSGEADSAQTTFEQLFQQKNYSRAQSVALPENAHSPIWIVQVLKHVGAVDSTSQAKRLIEGGAVTIDGEVIKEFKAELLCASGMVLKVGKHRLYRFA